jgi:hypothetical protein
MRPSMNVNELVAILLKLDGNAPVFLADLNGLLWSLEPDMIAVDADGDVVFDTKEINAKVG